MFIVQKADLVAVVHDFSDQRGSFYNEASYIVKSNGDVTMTVNGSSVAYAHSALGWLKLSSCYWEDALDMGFTWYAVKSIGTSVVYRFKKLDGSIRTDPVSLQQKLTNEKMYSDPQVVNLEHLCGVMECDSLVVLPWGNTLVVRMGQIEVSVPKRIVAAARIASLYTQRTPEQFQVVVRKVKEMVMRDGNIPLVDQPNVILTASAIGFITDVDSEYQHLTAVSGHLSKYGGYHAHALSFTSKSTWMYYGIAAAVVGCVYQGTWAVFLGLIVVLTSYAGVDYPVILAKTIGQVQTGSHSSVLKGGSVDSITLPGYQSERASKGPKKGATFVFSYFWRKLRDRGATLVGVGLATRLPVVSVDSAVNEERAIIHRALNTKLEPLDGLWLDLAELSEELVPTKIIRATNFAVWNMRFPEARRRKQAAALDAFESCPNVDTVRAACVRKAFIKREKLLKSTVLGVEDFDPRVIQGTSDLANALLGPWMNAFSKHLAHIWNAEHHVTYASGMNAEALGTWMTKTEEENFVYYLETDYSRFDASICKEALLVEQQVYDRCGAGPWAKCVLAQQLHVRGKSSHGHRYSITGTRCSGDPNTSCGNSMLNALVLVAALRRLGIFDFRLIVLGDDSVIALKVQVQVGPFVKILAKFGLVAVTVLHPDPDLVTFCSGRFWRIKGCS
jgi:hypothetical protein